MNYHWEWFKAESRNWPCWNPSRVYENEQKSWGLLPHKPIKKYVLYLVCHSLYPRQGKTLAICGYCSIPSLSVIRRTKIFLFLYSGRYGFLRKTLPSVFLSSVSLLQKKKTSPQVYKHLFYWLYSLSLLPSNLCWFEYFCNIEVSCHYFLQGPCLNTFVECVRYDNV